MKIKIAPRKCGVVELFDGVAREMGYKNASELNYDCRHINVAFNVQNRLYQYYTSLIMDEDSTITGEDAGMKANLLLLNYGPKVDKNLTDDEVEIFEGFIC